VLGEDEVGVAPHLGGQSLLQDLLRAEGLGIGLASTPLVSQVAFDSGDQEAKGLGDLLAGHPAITSGQHPASEVLRVRLHARTLAWAQCSSKPL
jgi:hypothetical protein